MKIDMRFSEDLKLFPSLISFLWKTSAGRIFVPTGTRSFFYVFFFNLWSGFYSITTLRAISHLIWWPGSWKSSSGAKFTKTKVNDVTTTGVTGGSRQRRRISACIQQRSQAAARLCGQIESFGSRTEVGKVCREYNGYAVSRPDPTLNIQLSHFLNYFFKILYVKGSSFLDASLHLFMRVCPPIGRSVGRSVGLKRIL